MNIVCQMDEDDEYSLHYEFWYWITKADKHNVAAFMKNVLQRGNPFNLEHTEGIMNISTGAILAKDEEEFLMNWISLGKGCKKWILWVTSDREKHSCRKLTGCDTTSKVGTKSRAVREGAGCYHLLYSFGRDALSDEMIADVEKFLLNV